MKTQLLALALLAPLAVAQDRQDYSPAERLLFMSDQLAGIDPPATLRYAFRKTGALEAGFEDRVSIVLEKQADGSCCRASGQFLSGARKVALPAIDDAKANPVTMYFLEHDVRDMQRLTRGQPNHFRKRIRMAIYNESRVEDVSASYRGQTIAARSVRIAPYANDTSRHRFARHADKSYVFVVSPHVPGTVVGVRSVIAGAPGEPPLIAEELLLEGASLPTEPGPAAR